MLDAGSVQESLSEHVRSSVKWMCLLKVCLTDSKCVCVIYSIC